jgi:hypothetical protein
LSSAETVGAGRLRADASTFDRDDDPPRPVYILREGDITCRVGRLVIVSLSIVQLSPVTRSTCWGSRVRVKGKAVSFFDHFHYLYPNTVHWEVSLTYFLARPSSTATGGAIESAPSEVGYPRLMLCKVCSPLLRVDSHSFRTTCPDGRRSSD